MTSSVVGTANGGITNTENVTALIGILERMNILSPHRDSFADGRKGEVNRMEEAEHATTV